MEALIADFKLRLCTAPQPVALALGRICRHPDPKEMLEATLKAAEIVTRYLAALAVSSFCARDDAAVPVPNELKNFRGNLSFGHFLAAIKGVSRCGAMHPIKVDLEAAFYADSEGETALGKLVELRNAIGHKLSAITRTKAEQILLREHPLELLKAALASSDRLLGLPLFLLEEQRIANGVVRGRRLLLMGDAEPMPDFVDLETPLSGQDNTLFVGLSTGALRLPPFLIWDIVDAKANYGLYLLHRAQEKQIEYLTVYDDAIERPSVCAEFEALLNGKLRPVESVTLKDGGNLLSEWIACKKIRLQLAQPQIGPIPWGDLNESTLKWYEAMLRGSAKTEEKPKKIGSLMVKMLLDGRDILSISDLRQIVLLFGKEKAVRALVKRPLVDCRARKLDSELRWVERKESEVNVFESLRVAIDFFTRHLAVEGATLDGLKATSGTADYIAMREAVVNMFIHQDYNHSGMAGQVEIRENQTLFFNPGNSLIPLEGILDGGKSTSRNPVISRAMRLIGFAELAGSGLYVVRNEWKKTRGLAPKIVSDNEANTFTLTFDWVSSASGFDEYWNEKLGVKLTPAQASILPALSGGVLSLAELASAVGISEAEAHAAAQHLKVQALVNEVDGKFSLRPDVLALLPKSTPPGS